LENKLKTLRTSIRKRRENIIINNMNKSNLIKNLTEKENKDFSYFKNKKNNENNISENDSDNYMENNNMEHSANFNGLKSEIEIKTLLNLPSVKSEKSESKRSRSRSSDSEISNQFYKEDHIHYTAEKKNNNIDTISSYCNKSENEKNSKSDISTNNNFSIFKRSYKNKIFWSKEKFETIREKLKIAKNMLIQKQINDFDELYILIDSDENEQFM
jgi:hypothetical protein